MHTRVASVLVLLLAAAPAAAQSPAPAFEVASVKENTSNDRGYASITLSPSQLQPDDPVQGTVTLRNIPLCNLIARAHELPGPTQRYALFNAVGNGGLCSQGERGFTGLLARRFDIVAKPPAGSRPADVFAMLRTLLADRFKLRLRREMRELPVYALTVARPGRLGPSLVPSDRDCLDYQRRSPSTLTAADEVARRQSCMSLTNGREAHWNSAGPISFLARSFVQSGGVDRLVVDATGLSGLYEWRMSYSRQITADAALPNIYTALREQLGLRLEPRRMPVEAWVIEHIEAPTPD